jgi:hypothetical protein
MTLELESMLVANTLAYNERELFLRKYQVMYDTRTTAYTSNKHSSLVLKRKTI